MRVQLSVTYQRYNVGATFSPQAGMGVLGALGFAEDWVKVYRSLRNISPCLGPAYAVTLDPSDGASLLRSIRNVLRLSLSDYFSKEIKCLSE